MLLNNIKGHQGCNTHLMHNNSQTTSWQQQQCMRKMDGWTVGWMGGSRQWRRAQPQYIEETVYAVYMIEVQELNPYTEAMHSVQFIHASFFSQQATHEVKDTTNDNDLANIAAFSCLSYKTADR